MVNTRKEIGNQAEQVAQQYLEANGFSFLDKNFSCRQGEIDLIMLDKNTIVFVEVKYRKNNTFSYIEESINHAKQKRLIHTSLMYLQKHPKYCDYQARFDVILITNTNDNAEIKWISNAFHA